jgi:hypothetical protein
VTTARFTVVAEGPAPVPASYAYLADPRTRARWQSSLRRVEDLRGAGEVGTTWTDVTLAGLRPRMRITEVETDRVWAEVGRWRSVTAELRMLFEPYAAPGAAAAGTRVTAQVELHTPATLAPVCWMLRALAPPAVRADLISALRAAPTTGRP